MLQPLGISARAEAIYVLLAPLESATLDELCELSSGGDTEATTAHLDELRRLGLAAEVVQGLWQAMPLLDVVNALRTQRLSEIETASVAAESLQSHLLQASESQADNIKILVGGDAILAARKDMCNAAKREICAFDKPPYVQGRPNATEDILSHEAPEWQAMDRGVTVRGVYHPGFDSGRLAELALFAQHGELSRTAPVPMKLILVDAQVALIPSMRSYTPGHELRASITRHPMLVEALQWLFETVWDTSVPIITSGYTDSNPRQQMLISLLMTGATDSAIATQLCVNVRSVRRWISELMDGLGVETRLQLGAALVRSGALRP